MLKSRNFDNNLPLICQDLREISDRRSDTFYGFFFIVVSS